ncbi:MAG: hypothetical protein WD766_13380 [Gemmatimonadota bacterium]
MLRSRLAAVPLLLLTLGAGCDGLLSPRTQVSLQDAELALVHVADDAPELLAQELTFWAVRGEEREAEIRYASAGGYNGKCLRFVVPAEALLRREDGSVIQPGDSVQIRVRVVDPRLYVFEFDPGGLRFDPAHPARIEVRYSWAAADIDDDGDVDDADEEMAKTMAIWRQEDEGDPWTKVPTTRLEELQEVHAEITGFTKYALASDRQGSRASF